MNWKLTQQAIGEPEIDEWDTEEEPKRGYSLLRELAQSDHTLVEIAPGMWWRGKDAEPL
jgi:hypothetical protein